MTNFIFENEVQIAMLEEKCFGYGGAIESVTEYNCDILLYLLSHRICCGKKVNKRSISYLEHEAKQMDDSLSIRVFFEKVQSNRDDLLYFFDKLNMIEKKPGFRAKYRAYASAA